MGKFWSDEEIKEFKLWEYRIKEEKRAKEYFPTVIMPHRLTEGCIGWTEPCPACGVPIKIRPDRSRYIVAGYTPCPSSDDVGHGIWASAINVTLN